MKPAPPSAAEWIERLDLRSHPEGGHFVESFRAAERVDVGGGFNGPRSLMTSIHYLLESDEFSAFHRLRAPELWLFHAGDALWVHELGTAGVRSHRVGPRPRDGDRLTLVVPAGTWFASEVAPGGRFGLVTCVVTPGFEYEDFELAQRQRLVAEFPSCQAWIERLTR
jgi:predicted cupin superfamily sugar epimerase